MRLAGKVAMITGGAAGIGRACVELFVREGARVLLADQDATAGETVACDARTQGGEVLFVETDVSKPEQMERAVTRAVGEFGGLDILYNNAGGSTVNDGPILTAPIEEFRRKIEVDLFGVWLGCRLAIPEMIRRGGGAIVNATSVVAERGVANLSCYTPAKGGISALTRALAVEYGAQKIRVNAVAPGSTLTERILTRRRGSAAPRQMEARHLLGLVDPLDVAHAVLFLASGESRRITGQILAVDSGYTIT